MEEEKEIEVLEDEPVKKKKDPRKMIALFLAIIGIILIILAFFLKEPVYVTITFDEKGGVPVEDITVKEGTVITLPETTKEGFTFAGWYWNDIKMDKNIKVIEDRELIAKWTLNPKTEEEIKTFEILFDSFGGSSVDKIKVECGKPVELPKSTREGYNLVGWKDRYSNMVKEDTLLACEDQKLTAVWEKIIVYTCPEGYTLSGRECIMTKEPNKRCKDSEYEITENNCMGTYKEENKCGTRTIHYEDGRIEKTEGDYVEERDECFYGIEENYVDDTCARRFGEGHYEKNHCYIEIGEVVNECPNNYIYMTKEQVQRKTNNQKDKAGCYEMRSYTSFCEEGYSLENEKCIKKKQADIVG